MTRVLLVTGARSLADHPGAEAWARALIREALAGVDLLIVGDAPGPDAWAWDADETLAPHRWQFCVRGARAGAINMRSIVGGYDAVSRWTAEGQTTHPLARNGAMVSTARHHMLRGCDVRVLALLDGLKADAPGRRATRGTEHTAGLAERAGLTVRREVWR